MGSDDDLDVENVKIRKNSEKKTGVLWGPLETLYNHF